jgi:hypothetical protein
MSFLQRLSGGASLAKASKEQPPKAINYDPLLNYHWQTDTFSQQHPGTWSQTYDQLDWWARQPIVQLPPVTRMQQVAQYCQPTTSPWTAGFQIGLVDEKAPMTKAAEATAREIAEVVYRAGGKYQWPPSGSEGANMETALSMFVRQSLIYDQAVFEVLETVGGKPYGWLVQDARMFRLARPNAAERSLGQIYPDHDRAFIQVDSVGQVRRVFGADEMCFFVRNPRADLRWLGYGFPEYDELAQTIDSCLRTFTYNDSNFKNGIHAHTIVMLRSTMDSGQFDAFRRNMLTMMTQPRNAHRAMIVKMAPQIPGQSDNGREDIDIKQIGQNNAEMEYSKWLDLMMKLTFAGFQMDPAECGFVFGNEGQTSSMGQQGPGERVRLSQKRGLQTILRKLQQAFTKTIVQRYDDRFCLRFTGVDAPSTVERLDMDIKSMKIKTLNEIRANWDLPALDNEIAEKMPADPSMIQFMLQGTRQGEDAPPTEDAGPLDEEMAGTDWNDTDEWTDKLAKALTPRARQVNMGAGAKRWTVEVK